MHLEEPRARIGYRDSSVSRAKQLAMKALVVGGGAVVLASAFVISIAVVTVGLALVLTVGAYLWWKTRDLRRQMRAGMQAPSQPRSFGRIIEGEVISPERTRH
jgi:hypothetical protein